MSDFISYTHEMFFKIQNDPAYNSDGFLLIKFSVYLSSLLSLYEKLIKVDVAPIEQISPEEKNRFWTIAKRYYEDQDTAIKASKAAYILHLLTK